MSMKGITPATAESLSQTSWYAWTVQSALSCSEHVGSPGLWVAQPVSVMRTYGSTGAGRIRGPAGFDAARK